MLSDCTDAVNPSPWHQEAVAAQLLMGAEAQVTAGAGKPVMPPLETDSTSSEKTVKRAGDKQ